MRDQLELRLAPFELTVPQWATLMRLSRQEDLSQSELGNSLFFDKATIGGILIRLEGRDLLQRRRDATDRRVIKVRLTMAGRRMVLDTQGFGREINELMLSEVPAEQRAGLVELLQAVLLRLKV